MAEIHRIRRICLFQGAFAVIHQQHSQESAITMKRAPENESGPGALRLRVGTTDSFRVIIVSGVCEPLAAEVSLFHPSLFIILHNIGCHNFDIRKHCHQPLQPTSSC